MLKISKFTYGLSLLLLLTISISSLPLSLLHHHEHVNECDIASAIPDKFKKEKDQYPKHYHTFETDCFLCFENHLTKTYTKFELSNTLLNSICFVYTQKTFTVPSISIIDLKGRDPPCFLHI